MRRPAALLLFCGCFCGLSWAQDEDEVARCVADLGSPNPWVRADAQRALLRMGDEILPRLREFTSTDPEVRRQLRALLRRSQRLHLQTTAPPGPLPIGSPLVLRVQLINETDESYLVPMVGLPDRGVGSLSPFHLLIAGEMHTLRPDQVTLRHPNEPWIRLDPGDELDVELTLGGEESPLRRPGPVEVEVVFETTQLLRRFGTGLGFDDAQQETVTVRVAAKAVRLEAEGRAGPALEVALASADPAERAGAVAELRLREDDAVLPLLRARLSDPELRLSAIRRLAGAAKAEDLESILAATADANADVRRAAVLGLGNFPVKEARRRLASIALADDNELIGPSVKALTRHRHAATIQCFLGLLKGSHREGPWLQDIHDALWEWTGLPVNCTRMSEINDFEQWWLRNREEWMRANPAPR